MINRIICYFYGHKFDKKRYEEELKIYYNFGNVKPSSKATIFKHVYENDPKPFCLRCKKGI